MLVRLATEDDKELRGGFPKTAEELFKYRAVILDDLEAEFFTADQMSLLQRFVSERGGGLLMLGGMESFREGKFARTAIGDMLPVYLDRQDDAPAPAGAAAPRAHPRRLAAAVGAAAHERSGRAPAARRTAAVRRAESRGRAEAGRARSSRR